MTTDRPLESKIKARILEEYRTLRRSDTSAWTWDAWGERVGRSKQGLHAAMHGNHPPIDALAEIAASVGLTLDVAITRGALSQDELDDLAGRLDPDRREILLDLARLMSEAGPDGKPKIPLKVLRGTLAGLKAMSGD